MQEMKTFGDFKHQLVGALVPIFLRARKDLKKQKKGWWYFMSYIMEGVVEARELAMELEKQDYETTPRIQSR